MSMKPILFNTDMVRAIQRGDKTVTRRVVKEPYYIDDEDACRKSGLAIHRGTNDTHGMPYPDRPYEPGDILYVREAWTKLYYSDPDGYTHYDQPMYYYAADGEPDIRLVDGDGFEEDDQRIRWRPSIHMPKEAARIFLRITGVRVERLQDITPEQAIAEGIEKCALDEVGGQFALGMFHDLWDSTIKPAGRDKYGWVANPWVWVIEFERISKEQAMS